MKYFNSYKRKKSFSITKKNIFLSRDYCLKNFRKEFLNLGYLGFDDIQLLNS